MKTSDIKKINQLKSDAIREMARYLLENGHNITLFAQTWTGATAEFMYFDTKIDLEAFRIKFNLPETIIIHENLDPKSGTESGFIDQTTGEGLMGYL